MYTLRIIHASEGYRRVAWLVLAAVTIWRAGYFVKSGNEILFPAYDWLEWSTRTLDAGDILAFFVLTLIEIAVVIAALAIVIDTVIWVCRGFNPIFLSELPELPTEFKAKLLRIVSRFFRCLSVALMGFVIFGLVYSTGHDRPELDLGDWIGIAVLVLASVVGWAAAGFMSRKARGLISE